MKGWKFVPLVVVAAGLLAYSDSFSGSFFHDDFGAIFENPTIRHLWPIWKPLLPLYGSGWTVAGRPLVNFSLAVNYALGGYHVWGYHALNLTVHILAGLTLFGIVRRTLLQPRLRGRWGAASDELALAMAVLWTVHPLQTESVTYIVQRAESMAGLFYLVTLYCFIRGAESARGRWWYCLSVTACTLGMASKPVAASAPVMVILYDRTFLCGSFREGWRRHWPAYLGLSATWIVVAYVTVSADFFATMSRFTREHSITRWQYLATQPGVILHYLQLCVWPHPLRFDSYRWPIARTWVSILPPAAVVVILLAAVVWALTRNSAWGFVGAWFFLILAPSSSFIPLIDLIFEHRMYLSLAAVVALVVMGLYRLMGRRSLSVIALIAIGLGFLTWRQNQLYCRNPHFNLGFALGGAGKFPEAVREYEQALRTTPNDAWLHYDLGVALTGLNRIPEAIEQWEQAVRINPDFAEAHYDLGLALVTLGGASNMPEAMAHWEQAVRINPGYAQAHYSLGVAMARLGRVPEAMAHWEQALRINPDYAEAHNNLGSALAQLGQLPAAIEHYKQALRIKPDLVEAHKNLGVALMGLGQMREAVAHLEQAVRLNPDYAEAHYSLGIALAEQGRLPEATVQWEQALRIRPDFAEAHYNLGVALERMGEVQKAIEHYEQAVRIKPNYAEARNRLARLRTPP